MHSRALDCLRSARHYRRPGGDRGGGRSAPLPLPPSSPPQRPAHSPLSSHPTASPPPTSPRSISPPSSLTRLTPPPSFSCRPASSPPPATAPSASPSSASPAPSPSPPPSSSPAAPPLPPPRRALALQPLWHAGDVGAADRLPLPCCCTSQRRIASQGRTWWRCTCTATRFIVQPHPHGRTELPHLPPPLPPPASPDPSPLPLPLLPSPASLLRPTRGRGGRVHPARLPAWQAGPDAGGGSRPTSSPLAPTPSTRSPCQQLSGALSSLYLTNGAAIPHRSLLAHVEAVLDFGEDEPDVSAAAILKRRPPPHLRQLLSALRLHLSGRLPRWELIRDGVDVCILGPVNVGKSSSLMNALARREVSHRQ